MIHRQAIGAHPCSILILLGLFVVSGCFVPKEGCLDIAAVNYNASADEDCCCRYPNLVLNVAQSYDTLSYQRGGLYRGYNGQIFRIENIVFYLSEFQAIKSGIAYTMGDSLDFKTYDFANNDTIVRNFTDDYTLIRRSPFLNTVATFREDGIFQSIACRLGFSDAANKIIPALTPANHPLRIQEDTLWRNKEFVFLQAIVARDSLATTEHDTLRFTRADLGDFFIQGYGNFEHQRGEDFVVGLKADWSVLFQQVDWATHNVAAWKSQIVANLPSVFYIYPE